MIKAVSFDFDHTLYNRNATYENLVDPFMMFFAEELREDVDRETALKVLQDCDRSGLYKDSHWKGIYRDTLETGIFLTNPTYEKYYNGFIEHNYTPAIVLYPDTLSTLQALRAAGYRLAILTNGPSDYQHKKIDGLHLSDYVDAVVVGGDLKHQKPHRYAFEYICNLLGCAAEETVYVGDNPRNDVDGARKAGLIPIWMRSVGVWLDDVQPAQYAIDALGQLPTLLPQIDRELEQYGER